MLGKLKRKIVVFSLLAMVLTLMSGATLGFYESIGKATGVITSGGIRFLIHEKPEQNTAFSEEGVYVKPGDVVSKAVSIESDCNHPFYLRVKPVYGVSQEELSSEDCLKLDVNAADWILYDGWYYYKEIVQPGQTTSNVFSHVEIVGNVVDNRYMGLTFTLAVTAQAVQSENNPLTDGKIYTASGWPAE